MKTKHLILLLLIFILSAIPLKASIPVAYMGNSTLEFGGLINIYNLFQSTSDDDYWNTTTQLRRARIKGIYSYEDLVKIILQTEIGPTTTGSGYDFRLIDAYAILKLAPYFQIVNGQHMAPANRQNLTSSAMHMTIDRPGLAYRSITWGITSKYGFGTSYLFTPVLTPAAVRDQGITIFGTASLNDQAHLKYYAGTYNGLEDPLFRIGRRWTGRVQLNMFESEPNYFNASTYLGTKKTVSIGLSCDNQPNLSFDSFDYTYTSLDFFSDLPLGCGSWTIEASYSSLDLCGIEPFAEGVGFYAQTGFYIPNINIQPWLLYETWNSDDPSKNGDYDLVRAGFTYFLKNTALNIKIGFENFSAANMPSVQSVIIGFFGAI
ncbi:hypothetical protein ACFL96_00195 [Thermoproteota archaeon]